MAGWGGKYFGGNSHWDFLGSGNVWRYDRGVAPMLRTRNRIFAALRRLFWGMIIASNLFILVFLVGLYFNFKYAYSVIYWLDDATSSVLQNWGI